MKLQLTKNKWLLFAAFMSTLIFLYALIVNFAMPYVPNVKIVSGDSLVSTSIPHITKPFIFFFYFTIQTNIFVMLYFIFIALGLLRPNEKKSHKIIEGFVCLSIFITFFIYWTVLSWASKIWTFPEKVIESLGCHLVAPIMMFVAFYYSHIAKEQKIELKYREFYWFIIYPIVWLIIAIILYYSSIHKVNVVIAVKGTQPTNTGDWILSAKKPHTEMWNLIKAGNAHFYTKTFITGYSIYYFFNFLNVPIWLPISVSIIITILFFTITLTFIKSTKKSFKFRDKILAKQNNLSI